MTIPTNRNWRAIIFATVLLFSAISAFGASEIPFTIEGGQLIIRAKIKNNVSVEVAVVTGSPYSYLHPDLFGRLKLPVKYTNDGPVTGRNDRIVTFTELEVVIGDEKPVNLYLPDGSGAMAGTTLTALSKQLGREISLAIGADAFKTKIVQFDFKSKLIRLLDAPPVDYKTASTAARSLHRMGTTIDTFYGGHITMPVISEAVLEGSQIKSNLDTGSSYAFLLSSPAARQLSRALPDKEAFSTTTLKTLKIGPADFTDVPGLVLGKNARPFDKERDYAAVIGLAVLQNLLVTIDWKKGWVIIEKL